MKFNWVYCTAVLQEDQDKKAVETAWRSLATLHREQQGMHDERNHKTSVVRYKTSAKLAHLYKNKCSTKQEQHSSQYILEQLEKRGTARK